MYVIGIFAKDVQRGDVVRRDGMAPVRVSEVRFTKREDKVIGVQLVAGEEEGLTLYPKDLLGLLHRPRPEGKTEYDMIADVISASHHRGPFSQASATLLRRTLDAYELGLPLEKAPEPTVVGNQKCCYGD